MKRHARWVSEALYQAWRSGVTLFVWHQLRDRPFPATQYQSGLYFCGMASTSDDVNNRCAQSGYYVHDRPKTGSVLSFRFPFVAYAKHGRVKVWGRTADGRPHKVVVERKVSGKWRRVKTLPADGHGILSGEVALVRPQACLPGASASRCAFERLLAEEAAPLLPPQHLGLRRHDSLPLALTVS